MTLHFGTILDKTSRLAAGAQVILLFVLGFGLQHYTTDSTCVKEIEAAEKNTAANYAGILVAAALAFVLECVRDRQTSLLQKENRKITAPAGPRIFKNSDHNSVWVYILELSCVATHLGTWVPVLLLNGPVHTAIDNVGNTVCKSAGVSVNTFADLNLIVAVASAVIWLAGVVVYWKNHDEYEDTVAFNMMNIRLGQLMRLGGAIGILIVSGMESGNNFNQDDACKNEVVYPFTSMAILGSIGIFFWSFYGCDRVVATGNQTDEVRVPIYAISRALTFVLFVTNLCYYIMMKLKTQADRGCPDAGWSSVKGSPEEAFIISTVMVIFEIIIPAVIDWSKISYDGRLMGTTHGVRTTADGGDLPIVGGGLRPATGMQTLRLTHDGPDRKPSSLSFV